MSTAPSQPRHDIAALAAALVVFAAGVTTSLLTGSGAALPVAPQLHGTVGEAVSIAVRNTAICAALIAAPHITVLHRRWPRNVVDVLAALVLLPATWLAAHVVTHPDGLALMPHAPVELAAVALAAAWWWGHHDHAPSPQATRSRLALVAALLIAAASIETFLVPHVR